MGSLIKIALGVGVGMLAADKVVESLNKPGSDGKTTLSSIPGEAKTVRIAVVVGGVYLATTMF
jgi:hypothetical protein